MTKKLTMAGLLTALAFALSYLEHLIPLQAVVPLPGIKLGLANTVTLFALLYLGKRYAFGILAARCILQTALFGSVTGFFFSVCGGLLALGVMSLLFLSYPRNFSVIGISIAGAAAHNIGQVLCAMVLFRSAAVISYLPILLFISLASGTATGYLCTLVFRKLDRLGIMIKSETGKD